MLQINDFIISRMDQMRPGDLPHGKADILVSEILGTLLLGESALEFTADARKHLLKPGARIVPAVGSQFVTLVQSADLESITSVRNWGGFDLLGFNRLQDTASVVFTKQYGFRFSQLAHVNLSERISIADVDFHVDDFEPEDDDLERRYRVTALADGTVHAALFSWEVHSDVEKKYSMTTHPEDTLDNFARDMQWGQAMQLIEDHTSPDVEVCGCPVPLVVTAGELLDIVVKYSSNGVLIQTLVERVA